MQAIRQLIRLIILTVSIPLAGAEFEIMAENMPPFSFEQEGLVKGISSDLLKKSFAQLGDPLPAEAIRIFPWARAYALILEKPGCMLFSVARTEPRENLFAWAGPITRFTIGLIGPKAKHIVIKTPLDAQQYHVGSIRDGAPEQLLIKAGFPEAKLDRAANAQQNIEKLREGRIDLFAFNVPTTIYVMRQLGMNPDDFEVVYELGTVDLCYAFHKATSAEFIHRLNQSIAEQKKTDATGSSPFDQIVKNYLGEKGFQGITFATAASSPATH